MCHNKKYLFFVLVCLTLVLSCPWDREEVIPDATPDKSLPLDALPQSDVNIFDGTFHDGLEDLSALGKDCSKDKTICTGKANYCVPIYASFLEGVSKTGYCTTIDCDVKVPSSCPQTDNYKCVDVGKFTQNNPKTMCLIYDK